MNFQLFDAYTNFVSIGNVDKLGALDSDQRQYFISLVDMAHQRDDMQLASYIKQGKHIVVVTPLQSHYITRIKRISPYINSNSLPFMTKWVGLNAFDRYKIAGWSADKLVSLILRSALSDIKMADTIHYIKQRTETVIYDMPM